MKTVNDSCHLCLVPLPPYLSPLFLQPCASVPCAPWRNPPRCDVCGASTGTYTRSLAFHTHGALHPLLHDPTLPPGRVARAYSIILGMSLHLHTFEPHSAPRVDVPLGHVPLTTTTHLSPVVLRVIGGLHGGHAPLSTTTHLSPVVLHVMEVPMEGACHSPHAPRSAARHMKAIGGSHITSRPPPPC